MSTHCDHCDALLIEPTAVTDSTRAQVADALAHELDTLRPMLDALLKVARVGSGSAYGSPFALSFARSRQAGCVRDAIAAIEKAARDLRECGESAREEDAAASPIEAAYARAVK